MIEIRDSYLRGAGADPTAAFRSQVMLLPWLGVRVERFTVRNVWRMSVIPVTLNLALI